MGKIINKTRSKKMFLKAVSGTKRQNKPSAHIGKRGGERQN